MSNYLESLKPAVLSDTGLTILILTVLIILRWVIVRQIRGGEETLSAERRKWISVVRNVTLFLIFASLVAIWLLEIANFALSVAAISVALVIANKELILCFIGGLYRMIARPFDVNDWVEIGPNVGEVLETSMLTTQLQELTSASDALVEYSGRVLIIPNAQLLTLTVNNFTYTRHFTYLYFRLVSPVERNQCENQLDQLKIELATIWDENQDLALRYWKMIRRRTGVDFPDPAPSVCLGTTETGALTYDIRLYCQRKLAKDIRNRITKTFLTLSTTSMTRISEQTRA